jgi:NAD(P)-dependent dehydrogenase (short-subunit alcohol dehydrogenase family)
MQNSSRSSRAILITGCSSGIGLCTALGLKARGYRVFASARKAADVAMLQSQGLETVRLDLACSTSIRSALEEVLRTTDGKLYGLFNNGAFGQPGAVEDLSREVLRAQFETNLFGTHELTRLVIPVMRRQGEGRILQNSSVLGFAAMPWRGAYNASKFALEGLTDTLRMELAGSGIHVCLIEPGPILSEFRANAYDLYKRNIDAETSVHRERYRAMEARLGKKGAAAPFTQGPEAVLKRVIHALESRKPKARYCVTFPTYLFAALKRVLSTRALDAILRRID